MTGPRLSGASRPIVLQAEGWIIRTDDWYIVGVSSAEAGVQDRKPSFLWAGNGAI